MRIKVMLSIFVLFSLLASCNMPGGQAPGTQSPEVDTIDTAVQLTVAAQLTETAGSVSATFTASPTSAPTLTLTPSATSLPTQCTPLVSANVVANVRSGPDTAYDVVGSLSQGAAAAVAGRNDASTWWYIDYPAGSGNHAWIAGTVVTAACLPAAVQVVAAPPFPTSVPQADAPSEDGDSSGTPDLVAYAMQYSPNGKKVSVMVSVKNTGNATAGGFTVVWLSNQDKPGCDWQVQGLGAGKSKNLECQYEYQWNATKYWSVLVVDSSGQVAESNEGNNEQDFEVNLNQ